jgi:group I intron endonuclease
MQYTVYLITNSINSKQYIGYTSKSIELRFHWHCNRRGCTRLRNALDKYGSENFKIEPIYTTEDLEDALKMESYYIKLYDTINKGYNLTEGGIAPRMSEETRVRMSQSHLGKKIGPMSEQQKRKISETRIKKGIRPSRENILKGLETKKRNAIPLPVDFGKKISERQKGVNNPTAKAVKCVQTGQVFDTIREAADKLGLNSVGIGHVLAGRNKTVGKEKYTFEYYKVGE